MILHILKGSSQNIMSALTMPKGPTAQGRHAENLPHGNTCKNFIRKEGKSQNFSEKCCCNYFKSSRKVDR